MLPCWVLWWALKQRILRNKFCLESAILCKHLPSLLCHIHWWIVLLWPVQHVWWQTPVYRALFTLPLSGVAWDCKSNTKTSCISALHLASNSWLHFKQNGASIEKEVSLTWGQHSINQSKKVLFKHAISPWTLLLVHCVAQSINGHEEICHSQTSFPLRN